jgi:hypothetical protein
MSIRIKSVVAIAAFAAVGAVACRSETADKAHKAAAVVEKERNDLAEAREDLREGIDKTDKGAQDVVDEVGDLAKAAADFVLKRGSHYRTVQAQLAVAEIDTAVLGSLAAAPNISASDRVVVDEKMAVLRLRVAETGRTISALENASSDEFPKLEQDAATAMKRLDDARDEAWGAIEDARDDIEASFRPPVKSDVKLP